MMSRFRLLTATLLLGISAAVFATPPQAGVAVSGALGGVGSAVGGVSGALGGGDSSGSTGNSSSGGSAAAGASVSGTVGQTKAKAAVVLRKRNFAKNATVTAVIGKNTNINAKALAAEIDLSLSLGRTQQSGITTPGSRPRSAAIAQMFNDLSATEQRKLVKKCAYVLASPAAFERDLVALCRMIAALDSQPVPAAAPRKQRISAAKPAVTPQQVAVAPTEPAQALSPPIAPVQAKAGSKVITCIGSNKKFTEAEIAQLEKDLPGCVIRTTISELK